MKLNCLLVTLVLFTLCSCNTYRWQKKRYADRDETKNWNNYNKKRTQELQDQRIKEEYYKKD